MTEFCKVNKLKEKELNKYLNVVVDFYDNSIIIVNSDDIRDVKLGIVAKVKVQDKKFTPDIRVFGEYTMLQGAFPETENLIKCA